MEQLKDEYKRLATLDKLDEYIKIVEDHLGEGRKISEATKDQVEILDLILDDLEDIE